jgi:hypothetical protein
MSDQLRLNPSGDYSDAMWSVQRLVEFRVLLGLGRAELADAAGVSEAKIVAVETGAKPLTEPLRSQIWNVIDRLFCEKAERDAKANPLPAEVVLNPLHPDNPLMKLFEQRSKKEK